MGEWMDENMGGCMDEHEKCIESQLNRKLNKEFIFIEPPASKETTSLGSPSTRRWAERA